MRSLVACAALAAGLVLPPAAVRAQTSTMATGTCTGSGTTTLAGTVGLQVAASNGGFQSVGASSVPFVFGLAECQCAPTDPMQQVNLQVFLTTPFPRGTVGNVEIWVGQGCDNYTQRTTAGTTTCQKIGTGNIADFSQGSSFGAGGIPIPIPGKAIFSPVTNTCDPNATNSNSVYIFFFTSASMPFASCTLSGITQQGHGPTGAANVRALPGDGAVTLSWNAQDPNVTSYAPAGYQVLCADDCGQPLPGTPPQAQYSTCVNGVLKRRTLPTGGSSVPVGTDGGVATDMGSASRSGGELQPEADPPVMNCTPDGGMNTTFVNDMGGVGLGPLSTLDPRFLCGSSSIGPGATSTRIDGLTNFKHYFFAVLAVDQYGNATVSNVLDAIPQPTEDLYRRYRDAGGPAGHCFIATAAFGSYENGWVQVLRDFRDESLLPHAWGHSLVDWYYAHSPPAADLVARHAWLRATVRLLLLPFIALAFFWVYFAAWQKAIFVTLVVALFMRKRLAAAIAARQEKRA